MGRRFAAMLAMVLTLSLALSGCGGAGTSKNSSGSGSGTGAAPVLTLGAAISMSGNLVKEGGYLKAGYEIWKEKVNAAGGIQIGDKKYKVEIKYYDDKSDTETSVKLTEKLITEDGIKLILGPFSSGITSATAAVAEKYQAITMSTGNSNAIYSRGFKYIFGIYPLASNQGHPIMELAKAKGLKTVAIVTPDDLWAKTVAEGAKSKAESLGLEVVYFQSYPKGSNDLSSVVNQVKGKNPDLLFGTGYLNEITLMTKQMKELQLNPKMVALAAATTFPDYLQGLGKDANGVIGVDWWTPATNYKGGLWVDAADFAKEFHDKYNYPATYQSAAGAAAGELLRLALERAGSTEVDKVRSALLALDTEIFFGKFKFDQTGANVSGTGAAVQIVNGEYKVVYPDQVKQQDVLLPKPVWGQ